MLRKKIGLRERSGWKEWMKLDEKRMMLDGIRLKWMKMKVDVGWKIGDVGWKKGILDESGFQQMNKKQCWITIS